MNFFLRSSIKKHMSKYVVLTSSKEGDKMRSDNGLCHRPCDDHVGLWVIKSNLLRDPEQADSGRDAQFFK